MTELQYQPGVQSLCRQSGRRNPASCPGRSWKVLASFWVLMCLLLASILFVLCLILKRERIFEPLLRDFLYINFQRFLQILFSNLHYIFPMLFISYTNMEDCQHVNNCNTLINSSHENSYNKLSGKFHIFIRDMLCKHFHFVAFNEHVLCWQQIFQYLAVCFSWIHDRKQRY